MPTALRIAAIAAVASASMGLVALTARRIMRPASRRRALLLLRGDRASIEALRRSFDIDKSLAALSRDFIVDFAVVSNESDGPNRPARDPEDGGDPNRVVCAAPTASSPSDGAWQSILVEGEELVLVREDIASRRRANLPPFIVRWLRQLHAASSSTSSSVAKSGGDTTNDERSWTSTGATPSVGGATNSSGECMESGAVAGALPGTRRRRTVEERVQRVALDVIAPLTQRAAAVAQSPSSSVTDRRASSASRSPRKPLSLDDLPFDTFAADLACGHLHQRAEAIASVVAPQTTAANGIVRDRASQGTPSPASGARPCSSASEYVAALVYLLDVHAAAGERVLGARLVSDEAAARILEQHNGELSKIEGLLEVIVGTKVRIPSPAHVAPILRQHAVAIASHAVNSISPGAFAGGATNHSLSDLLRGTEASVLLALPHCSLGAIYLLREIYDAVYAYFGPWNMGTFAQLMAVLFERGGTGKQHPSGWSRIFRSMNRSRSGEISFTEFVGHFTKKVSACGDDMDPDAALVLCLARLRLTHVLFYNRRADWPGRSFWFDALVDMHDADVR